MDFWDFLQTLPGILIILFIGFGLLLSGIIGAWAKNWREVKLATASADLKTKMIERGMSAEEIERVLLAERGTPSAHALSRPAPGSFADSALYAMIENGTDAQGIVEVIEAGLRDDASANEVARWMAENGYEGGDIALVVKALTTRRSSAPPTMPASHPSRPDPDIDLDVRRTEPAGV